MQMRTQSLEDNQEKESVEMPEVRNSSHCEGTCRQWPVTFTG